MLNSLSKYSSLIILLFFFIVFNIFSQTKIDSLENKLKISKNKEKPEILNKLARNYMNISLDTSMEYANTALELAKKSGNKEQEANALKYIGVAFYYKSNYDIALEYYKEALKKFKELNDEKEIAKTYNNIGNVYINWCNYEKAIEYYNNSLEISQKIEDKQGIAFSLNNIGIVYKKWGNYEKAIKYYNNSLEIKQKIGDKKGIAQSLNNIGIIFKKQRNYEKAIEYYNNSLKIRQEIGNKQGIAQSLNNIGIVYEKWSNYEKAIEYYNNSLEITQKIGDKKGIASTLNNIGLIYKKLGDYEKAIKNFNKSLKISQSLNLKEIIYKNYLGLSEVSTATGNHQKALEYYKQYTTVKDSVFNKESSKKIAELEVRYETEKKDKQIKDLKYENNLKTIKISHQKKLYTIYLIAFIFALISITIILIQFRKKNIAYKFLVAKNLDLLNKEQELKILKTKTTLNKSNNDRKITITDNIKEEIIEKLEQLLDTEKIFKDFDLTIDKLAKNISTNRNYLSQTIYKEFGKNYSDFINEYRVKEAMLLFSDSQISSMLSIEGIAKEVGFRSVPSFNSAFKKFAGIIPSKFRTKTKV
ncbi:MAG: tetratricopeptide repeat protein [Bacteroidales bacterium]|nr:tetratricopeptide repeat protein [Bacteroidales bacterium]